MTASRFSSRDLPLFWLVLALLVPVLAGDAEALTLVKDGEPASVIVIPKMWYKWQKVAAEELQYHFEKMSGASVPIVTEDRFIKQPGQAVILVGQTEPLTELGIDTTKLPAATLIVRTMGNALVVAGEDGTQVEHLRNRPRREDLEPWGFLYGIRLGSMYAVFELLDKQFKCRWLWPGETGEVIPKRATLEVPDDLDLRKSPPMIQRSYRSLMREHRYKNTFSKWAPRFPGLEKSFKRVAYDENMWMIRQRMGRNYYFGYGHSFTNWWRKYGKTHPDLFALQPDGSRGCQKGGRPKYVKMCVSNPKLHEMLTEQFREKLAKNPDLKVKSLAVCENDGDRGFCVCDRCREWDIVEGTGKPYKPRKHVILSERYARFYNVMARRVREIDPEAFVIGYAYSWYQPPPRKVVMEPNVVIPLSEFSVYPRPEGRDWVWGWLDGWSRGGSKVILRPNSFWHFVPTVPYVVHRQMAEDLKKMIDGKKIIGTDFDYLNGFWATDGLSYYVLARLQWEPSLSIEAALEEYYAGFGPAGPVVREYFDYWEQFTNEHYLNNPKYDEIKKRGRKGHHWHSAVAFYTPEALAKGSAILDKAKPLLEKATEEQRERFRNIELGLRHVELTLDSYVVPKPPKPGSPEHKAKIEAARALMDFRREIVERGVVNVYTTTDYEMRDRANYVGALRPPAPDPMKAAGLEKLGQDE